MDKIRLNSKDDFDRWKNRYGYCDEFVGIETNEPLRYPCMMCWDYEDVFTATYIFIYADELKDKRIFSEQKERL